MALEDFNFDNGFGVLAATQEFVDPHCSALAVGDAINDQTRAEDAIATGKDSPRRGHERFRVHCNQPAGRQLYTVFWIEEVQPRRLSDSHDDGVALQQGFAALVERWIEALVLIEDPFRLQRLQGDNSAIFANHTFWAESGMHDDAFGFSLFNLFQRRRHFFAIFQADEVHFLRAQAKSGK